MSNILASMYEIDGRIEIDNLKSNLSIFITPWSISHFVVGYMTQAFGINYLYGLIGHTIYEYINYVNYNVKNKWSEEWKGFKKDSTLNGVGDTFVFLLGMMLAKNYNNFYLFIFIFLVGLLFYFPYVQDYLIHDRLQYLKSKNNTLKIENRLFNLDKYYTHYIWAIASLIVFIKLKILNKKFK